ncbi:PRC-barrel domain-containing protein, partial [Klebsiella pneumoniae]|uniref:PRC-barrel domain-containing protein n=1 Tax=Klebsiella pneumoniae TaxID=573 RepID=UPI00226D5223
EIVKGEPDIRGWDVRYKNGEKIGSVEELILDAKAKKVRYMVVDLDENELRLEHRKVLIPIGFAELDKSTDDVLIPNVSMDQL